MSTAGTAERSSTDIAPLDYLKRLGEIGDGPHDIGTAALMLAALDHPEKKMAPFKAHLAELGEAIRAKAEFARDGEAGARALASILAGRYGYDGERMNYDDPYNADLMVAIERRRGLPVTLGILYIHGARAAGMEASGLLAPGHFIMRIEVKGLEALVDPFNGGTIIDRDRMAGPHMNPAIFADVSAGEVPNPLETVSDTDVLLRLQNNIKNRALKLREVARAIEIARRMTIIAPRRPVLWLELGRLQESTGSLSAARGSYERGLSVSRPGDVFYNEAVLALQSLKRRLN